MEQTPSWMFTHITGDQESLHGYQEVGPQELKGQPRVAAFYGGEESTNEGSLHLD